MGPVRDSVAHAARGAHRARHDPALDPQRLLAQPRDARAGVRAARADLRGADGARPRLLGAPRDRALLRRAVRAAAAPHPRVRRDLPDADGGRAARVRRRAVPAGARLPAGLSASARPRPRLDRRDHPSLDPPDRRDRRRHPPDPLADAAAAAAPRAARRGREQRRPRRLRDHDRPVHQRLRPGRRRGRGRAQVDGGAQPRAPLREPHGRLLLADAHPRRPRGRDRRLEGGVGRARSRGLAGRAQRRDDRRHPGDRADRAGARAPRRARPPRGGRADALHARWRPVARSVACWSRCSPDPPSPRSYSARKVRLPSTRTMWPKPGAGKWQAATRSPSASRRSSSALRVSALSMPSLSKLGLQPVSSVCAGW